MASFLQNLVKGAQAGMQGYQQGSQFANQMSMQDLARQRAVDQQQEMERKRRRDEQFRTGVQTAYQQQDIEPRPMNEVMGDLYAQSYPKQFAEMQMKALSDPYAAQKMQLRQQAEDRRSEQLGLNREKVGLSGQRIENLRKKLSLAQKLGNARLEKNTRDEIFREKKLIADEADRQWKNEWQMNKLPYEYAEKQTQLSGQVPSALRDSYRGTIASGSENAQDLTPLAVKEVTSATEGVSKILRSTDKLIDMVDKNGLEFLLGEGKAKMETLLADMALTYKGEAFAGLGVLTGPDLDILLDVMGNPTKLAATTADIQKAKLNEFREMLLAGYDKKLDARGFNPVSPNQIKSVGGSDSSSTTVIKSAVQRAKERRGK